MNYKKKGIIFSFFLIISIQILLLINNRQKTSFRYFVWNIKDVTIGRLICVSFISGITISTLLNKTIHNNKRNFLKNKEEDKTTTENDFSINTEKNNESNDIPPERDIRDPQPTISVNYRVIKDNYQNEENDKNQNSSRKQYKDDWNYNESEW